MAGQWWSPLVTNFVTVTGAAASYASRGTSSSDSPDPRPGEREAATHQFESQQLTTTRLLTERFGRAADQRGRDRVLQVDLVRYRDLATGDDVVEVTPRNRPFSLELPYDLAEVREFVFGASTEHAERVVRLSSSGLVVPRKKP